MTNQRKSIMIKFFIIFLSVLFLYSCSSAKRESLIPINEENVNNQIVLRAPNYANNFLIDHPVILELKNTTGMVVVFPRDFNIQLFVLDKKDWVEIKEQPVDRYPEEDVILSRDNPIVQVLSVFPDYPGSNKDYYLRVYVVGELQDEMRTLVAAYTDIKISK